MILEHLPAGFVEGMQYGMISYYIPLERYPDTYNDQPLAIAALASQKRYMSLYLMGIYANEDDCMVVPREVDALRQAARHGQELRSVPQARRRAARRGRATRSRARRPKTSSPTTNEVARVGVAHQSGFTNHHW